MEFGGSQDGRMAASRARLSGPIMLGMQIRKAITVIAKMRATFQEANRIMAGG